MMNSLSGALTALALLWLQPAVHASGDALVQARQLYESASYEQALDVLDGLQPSDTSTMQDAQTARRYRVFCLVALDRNADAEHVLEELVRADPTDPIDSDLSPRVDALVKKVRQRVARAMVKDYYEQGRSAYDRGQYAQAAARLGDVMKLVQDPALGLATDPSLADLRVLADGFLTLSQALIPTAAPARPATTGQSPIAENPPVAPARAAAPAPQADPPRPESTPSSDPTRPESKVAVDPVVFTQDIPGVSASGFTLPKRISQPIPRFDAALAGSPTRREGVLEFVVGVDGSVVSAEVKLPTNPTYDALLVATARHSWKYEPATRLGVAVPYRLRVKFVLPAR